MELYESNAFVEGCFHDESASCECACPFHLDIRSFLKKAARGRWPAAYRDLCTAIPFPSIAAELCPRPCERRCQRTSLGDDPLNMGALEHACIHFSANEKAQAFPLPPKSERIAVVGAGPAGLSCALSLARKKYQITVFDCLEGWGGHLRDHPCFSMFDADFSKQFEDQPVEFRYNTTPEESTLSEFNAVYIATGCGGADFGLKASWDASLFTTSRPGWFLGGGVCDMPLMDSIAAGTLLSPLIEAYLQTGRASLIVEQPQTSCEGHFVEHPGIASAPRIIPVDAASGYSKEEAKAEASRCMQCVCDFCMTGCELMQHYRKAPLRLASEISGDSHTTPPLSNCQATRQTYSCNLCGKCGDLCSEQIDLGNLFRFSREDRWQQGKWAPGLHDYWLRELDFNNSEGFYASSAPCEFLFFPGCQLTASEPDHVLQSWQFLRQHMDIGILLACCGAPAIWAGDKERASSNLDKLRSCWERMGKPTVITACATCTDLLSEQIPEMPTRSLYEILDTLPAPVAKLPFSAAAVFDPCAARKNYVLHNSVQSLAAKAGCRTEDLNDGGNCCGYGGHIRLANPDLYLEITDHRAAESDLPYLVYCANCLEVFRSKNKPCLHILDAVFGSSHSSTPTLEEKRLNTLNLKGQLMEQLDHTGFTPQTYPWDALSIQFSAVARAQMEEKLITDRDVKETVFQAEETQTFFTDEEGLRIASLARKVLTYWVEYRISSDGTISVESAYCHRMHIGEES